MQAIGILWMRPSIQTATCGRSPGSMKAMFASPYDVNARRGVEERSQEFERLRHVPVDVTGPLLLEVRVGRRNSGPAAARHGERRRDYENERSRGSGPIPLLGG